MALTVRPSISSLVAEDSGWRRSGRRRAAADRRSTSAQPLCDPDRLHDELDRTAQRAARSAAGRRRGSPGASANRPAPTCRRCGSARAPARPAAPRSTRSGGERGKAADHAAPPRARLAQHVLEDAAAAEIFQLVGGIDPDPGREAEARPVGAGDLDRDLLARGELGDAEDGERLGAVELRRRVDELERDHAHADQVGAVDALIGLGDDRADAEQVGALRRPVAAGAGAIFLAGDDDERRARPPCRASPRRRSASARRSGCTW